MATLTADTLTASLEDRLNAIDCAGTFYSYQQVPQLVNPGLQIVDLGRFGSPLYERDVRTLINASHQSPFGKGEDTLVDTDVRRSFEIDAKNISFTHPNWARNEKQFLETACTQLGVGGGSSHVRAELYKLLIYEEGAMFKPHKDSEKAEGMFATMVICLPGPHEGGEVALTFNGESAVLATDCCLDWQCSILAWYADVLHEVKPVRSGFRVALTYNLIYTGVGAPPNVLQLDESKAGLRAILGGWRHTLNEAQELPPYIAYPLEHKYTEANLSLAYLKRRDAARVVCTSQVAGEYSYRCCLAILEKYVVQQEDAEEDMENSLELIYVADLQGRALLKGVPISEDAVTCDIDDGEADSEDEEVTGNEGTTRSYWYRNCVLLILPDKHYVDLAMSARSGSSYSRTTAQREFVDTSLTQALESRKDARQMGYLERICELIFKQQAPRSYDYGSERYPDDLTAQLVAACLQHGFHDVLELGLRSASPYMARLVLDHILLFIPSSSFPESLQHCIKTALSRLASLKSRVDNLQKVTAVMTANGMACDAQAWQVEQSDRFLSMQLGEEDEVVPILMDMIRQQNDADWISDKLLPAMEQRGANIGILAALAAKLLSLADDLSFDRQEPASPSEPLYSFLGGRGKWGLQKPVLPVSPPDLSQAHWNLVELQLLDEAGSISTRIMEQATSMHPELLSAFAAPYLQHMAMHWPIKHVAYNDPHYHMLFSSLISTYIHRYVQREPRPTWVKKPIGCGQCQYCRELDTFLVDPNRSSHTFSIYYKHDVDHLKGLCTWQHSSMLEMVSEHSRKNPYILTANKLDYGHEAELRGWKTRANSATSAIRAIAEEGVLRQILGSRHEELTMLSAVRASAAHMTQTSGAESQWLSGQQRPPGPSANMASTMPAQLAGTKRRHD